MRKILFLLLTISIVITLSGCYTKDNPQDFTAKLNASLDTIEVNSEWVDPGCTTTGDSCSIISDTNTIDTTTTGEYIITYIATNDDTIIYLKRVITVVDTIPPVLSLNLGIDTIIIGEEWIDGGCIVNDNYDSNLVCSIYSNSVNTNVTGEYKVVYFSEDSNGNKGFVTRYVFVIDE